MLQLVTAAERTFILVVYFNFSYQKALGESIPTFFFSEIIAFHTSFYLKNIFFNLCIATVTYNLSYRNPRKVSFSCRENAVGMYSFN
jgi:hypothetical protein